jgi:mannose/fructose/N-acetylgalactosamine-specific phosphotransferase system component IIB
MNLNRVIIRVDDRLVHGQVVEGWVKHLKIKKIYLVNDRIANDPLQKMIYESIVPSDCSLEVFAVEEFLSNFYKIVSDGKVLILVESVDELFRLKGILSEDFYINIGCVASRVHKIEVTDTVFLTIDEIRILNELRNKYNLHIKKLPWETEVEIKNFLQFLENKE